MDNGLSSLVAGKRRRDGYVNDNEDVKENLKASRPWYGSNNKDAGGGGGGHSSFVPSLEALNNVRSSSGKHQHDGSASSGPSLNMEQRVMAAAALQDLRGITESSKVYYQQAQKYAQPQLINNSEGVANITTLGDSSSTVVPPLPVPLPPLPYIRTPPLLSEAETHNGSPSSSSSGPYPASSLQQPPGGVVSQYYNNNNNGTLAATTQRAPPHVQQQQLPELESESSFSSLMQHAPSQQQQQSNVLHQQQQQGDRESGLHGNAGLDSYQQRDHEFAHGHVGMSQNAVLLQSSRSLVSNGVAGFHHGGHHALPPSNGYTQNGNNIQQVLPNVMPTANQLPHGDSQRFRSNAMHQRHGMASSSHHHHHHQQQQAVHSSLPNGGGVMHQQQSSMHAAAQNSMHHRMHNQQQQEGLLQFQNGGLIAQSNIAPQQQPNNYCSSSNGGAGAAAADGCSSGVQHHQEAGFSPLHGDFHQVPNSWYPSSMRESTTTVSETQQQPSVSTSRLLLPPSAGINSIPCLPQQQISQVQNGFGEPQIPDQDHSSSSAVNNVANGGGGALDDPALVQRALMRPPPRLTRRSYTKVYKLGSITRAVDVNRFKNYTELRCGLAHMFNLEGPLDQKHGWQLIFTDNEDDLLLVGDDPWEEFVKNVRAIRILTPAEVFYYTNEDKWTAATYNSNGGSAPKLL